MAFNVKYKIESTSDVFGLIRLNILQEGYTGNIIELDGAGRDWITLNIGGNTQDITDVVLTSNLNFRFYVKNDFQTIEFGDSSPFTFLVELYKVDSVGSLNEVIWKGWIKPDEYSESYTNTPYVAIVNCSDGLEELKSIKYQNIAGKEILFNQIVKCLNETGLDLNIKESVNIYDDAMTNTFLPSSSPFMEAQVENLSYFEISQDVTCYDVLVAILRPFFARIYQYRGWNIENIDGKKSSYVERTFNSNLSLLNTSTINPTVELDNNPTNFKAFLSKSGSLEFKPSINNCEVYFNTSTPDSVINIRGFDSDDDWIDNNNLKDWTNVGGVIITKTIVNFDGFVNAVQILGKNSSLSANQFIQSKFVSIDKDEFQSLRVGFKYYMNYPSIILLGSKPIFYVEIQLFVQATNTSFFWNNGWREERQYIRIDANGRKIYRDWEATIDEIPASGQLRFRFHKLVKSGDTGNTELRLTGFFTELQTGEKENDLILKESASSPILTDYEGAGFEHFISDGVVLDRLGVMDVGGVLTGNWSRRGKIDNLNIRRLFLLQWLSMLQKPTSILSGDIYFKGESITPINVIKDKDAVRSTRYLMTYYNIGLCNGIGSIKCIELPLNDVSVTYFEESVNRDRVRNLFPDFRPSGSISPIRSITNNVTITGSRTSVVLNGDVTGDPNTVVINPSAITNKELIDMTNLPSSRVAINAVEDTEDQENMTKTTVKDLFGSWQLKDDPTGADQITIIDADDDNEIKVINIEDIPKQETLISGENIKTINGESILGQGDLEIQGGAETFTDLTDTPSSYQNNFGQLLRVNDLENGIQYSQIYDYGYDVLIGDFDDPNIEGARCFINMGVIGNYFNTDSIGISILANTSIDLNPRTDSNTYYSHYSLIGYTQQGNIITYQPVFSFGTVVYVDGNMFINVTHEKDVTVTVVNNKMRITNTLSIGISYNLTCIDHNRVIQ